MAAPVKIALTGAAGLVGQNLIPRLKARGYTDIVALDKHKANVAILRQLHPDIVVIEADLAQDRRLAAAPSPTRMWSSSRMRRSADWTKRPSRRTT